MSLGKYGKVLGSNILETPKVAARIIKKQGEGTLGVTKKVVKNVTQIPKKIVDTNIETISNFKNFATDKNYRRQNLKNITDVFKRNKNYNGGYIAKPN
jgi:hypothetical protein